MGGSERGTSTIHDAGNLSYSPDCLRDVCWPKLPADSRERLKEAVGGQILRWWATLFTRGSYTAVALGPTGLCHAVIAADRKAPPQLRTARFAPESLWVLATGAPDPLPAPSSPATSPGGMPSLENSLSADFRGLLGNLPPITQILLQERFSPRPDLAYSYYAEHQPSRQQTTWRFLCYIADDTTLMFGSGTKVTPARGGEAAWDITCHRATITAPIPP